MPGLAPTTVRRYRRAVETLLGNLDLDDVADLSFAHLERHLRDLFVAGLAESTRAGALAAIRSFCEYLVLSGDLPENPARRLRGPRPYRSEADVLTVAEAARLVYGKEPGTLPAGWLAARNQVLVAVSFAAGLRVSEVGRLLLRDVARHDETGRWSVLVRGAKWSDEDTRIEIRDRKIGRMLGAWLTRRGVTPSPALFPPQSRASPALSERQVQRVFQRLVHEAEIAPKGRKLTFHVLRHTLGTRAAQAGWELTAIKVFLRHRSIRTTARYLHTSDRRLDELWQRHHPLASSHRRVDLRRASRLLLGELSEVVG